MCKFEVGSSTCSMIPWWEMVCSFWNISPMTTSISWSHSLFWVSGIHWVTDFIFFSHYKMPSLAYTCRLSHCNIKMSYKQVSKHLDYVSWVGSNIMIIKLWRSIENAFTLLITLANKINNMSRTMVNEDKNNSIFVEGFSCRNKKPCQIYVFIKLKVSNAQFLQGDWFQGSKYEGKKYVIATKSGSTHGVVSVYKCHLYVPIVQGGNWPWDLLYSNTKAKPTTPTRNHTPLLFKKITNLVKSHHYERIHKETFFSWYG